MNPEDIPARLNEELCAALGLEPQEIHPGSNLVDDLGAESIDLIDLTFRIEKAFDIRIPEGELFEDVRRPTRSLTVADVAAYIAERKNPPAP